MGRLHRVGSWSLVGFVLLLCSYVMFKHEQVRHLRRIEDSEHEELGTLRIRLAELSGLFDAASLFSVHLDVGRVLGLVCQRVVAALDADLAAVLLVDAEGTALVIKARDGKQSDLAANLNLSAQESVIGQVVRHCRMVVLGPAELAAGAGMEQALAQLEAVAAVPVLIKARIGAVLLVGGRMSLRDDRRLAALGLFAGNLGAALSRLDRERQSTAAVLSSSALTGTLVEYNRKMQVFLATATHELRTPLAGIISYAEVLADYFDTLSDEERRSLCSSLNEQCKTMMGLVDELFDFARLESGRLTLDPEPTRVGELIGSAIDLLASVAAERGLKLERQLADSGPVVLDPTKIRQCVLNLLTNAIKFTPDGGTISVKLSSDAAGVQVSVTDTGRGVPPDQIERIFDLFHTGAGRGDSKSLGLGLYLVKSFVELHGGRVWVKSSPGEGSTFAFALPWSPPRASLELEARAA